LILQYNGNPAWSPNFIGLAFDRFPERSSHKSTDLGPDAKVRRHDSKAKTRALQTVGFSPWRDDQMSSAVSLGGGEQRSKTGLSNLNLFEDFGRWASTAGPSADARAADLTLLEHVSPVEWDNVVLYGQFILDRKVARRPPSPAQWRFAIRGYCPANRIAADARSARASAESFHAHEAVGGLVEGNVRPIVIEDMRLGSSLQ
jgi:hypothetical protein